MSELIYCKAPLSYTPFYLEHAGINIYSLEELSYLSLKNTDLITEDIMSYDFTTWIGEELLNLDLKKELDILIANNSTLNVFMGRILKYTGYLTEREKREALLKIATFRNKSEADIRKIRADRLLQLERYSDAIFLYFNILDDIEKLSIKENEEGNIYHNIGVCYSRMFFFKEAVKSFKIAYSKNHNTETIKELLFLHLILNDIDNFNKVIEDNLITPDIVDEVKCKYDKAKEDYNIHSFFNEIDINVSKDREKILSLINIWKDEYIKNSGI